MVKYARSLGEFLDTPASWDERAKKSFQDSPNYNFNDYIEPRGGWKTFNQFFARNFKPGYRPIANVANHNVITSPADSTFAVQYEIRKDSHITVKSLHWTVAELLDNSPYKDRFVNGTFMHAFLNTTDYHRQHAPVAGTVLEARFIPGQVYLEVDAQAIDEEPINGASGKAFRLAMRRQMNLTSPNSFNAEDNAGYQFAQARGLIVIDSPIGLVAVLPIGMAQVSSVVVTAEVGVTLRKGEEISYFQFGGSDIVVLFEAKANVSLTAQPNIHYKTGTKIGEAHPVV